MFWTNIGFIDFGVKRFVLEAKMQERSCRRKRKYQGRLEVIKMYF